MQLVPIGEYQWTDDFSFHRELTCRNHLTARYLTKNPWQRSIHIVKRPEGEIERTPNGDCTCPFTDLAVVVRTTDETGE